jgi:hypothetical protein
MSNIDQRTTFALRHAGSISAPPSASSVTESPSCSRLIGGREMPAVREFVDFWLTNSVHADEQMVGRRGREDILKLADRFAVAANCQGFTKQQIEAEIGDIYAYIRARIDSENVHETARLRLDGQ